MPTLPEGIVPLEDCLEWADKYEGEAWGRLVTSAGRNDDHSPKKIFGSLVWYARYMHETLQAAQFVLGVEYDKALQDPDRYDETREGAEIIGETLREIDTFIGPTGAVAQPKEA